MISILAMVMLSLYLVLFAFYLSINKMRQFKWIIFNAAIIITIFVALGRSIRNASFITLAMLLYDFTAVIYLSSGRMHIKANKKCFFFLLLLSMVLLLSLLNLIINPNMPGVILMDTSMDSVYYGQGSIEKAVWSHSNIAALRDMILMCAGVFFSIEYLSNYNERYKLLTNIRKAFYVFFIAITIEFVMNNLFSPTILRGFVYSILNVDTSDVSKIWTAENRFGYYGVTALFPEQSYISLLIIFYLIVYDQRIRSNKDLFWFLYSIVALFMSGCTTGLTLLPLSAFIYIRDILIKAEGGRATVRIMKCFPPVHPIPITS